MDIRGEALIQVKDEFGNIVEEITASNDICWPMFRRMFYLNVGYNKAFPTRRTELNNSTSGARWYIYYGSKDIKPTNINAWYHEDGFAAVNQDTPTYTDGATESDPDIVTFSAVINAPTTTSRTIRVIGLYAGLPSGGDYRSSLGQEIDDAKTTILKLETPCIQAINNTVTITYRLFLQTNQTAADNRVYGYLLEDIKSLFKSACTSGNVTFLEVGNMYSKLSHSAYDFNAINNLRVHSIGGAMDNITGELTDKGLQVDARDTPSTRYSYANVERVVTTYSLGDIPSLGCFSKTMFITGLNTHATVDADRSMFYVDTIPGIGTPVQSVFPQRANPPGPFQDLTVDNTATMGGNIALTSDNWVDPSIQRLARVVIVDGGATGTATYKIQVCNFVGGFVGNRWIPRTAILPQALTSSHIFRETPNRGLYETGYQNTGGITYRSPDDEKYVVAASNFRTKSGINVYNIFTGDCVSINSDNGLNVTAVSDCAVSKGYTFVSCANTGLWRISPDFNTIEFIPSPTLVNKAYQLSAKNAAAGGDVWVMFDGGLCKLTNPDAAVGDIVWTVHKPTSLVDSGAATFSYTNITDNNWDKVTSMTIDPDDPTDDKFLIISSLIADTTGKHRKGFIWWSSSTGNAVNPTSNGIGYSTTSFVWNETQLLRTSDSYICTGGRWYIPQSYAEPGVWPNYPGTNIVNHCTYGSNNLEEFYVNAGKIARAIPCTFNGISGVLYTDTNVGTSEYQKTSPFITNANMAIVPNNTTLNITSTYIDFVLRQGISYYSNNLENNTENGSLSGPLIYLSKSNFIFGFERRITSYSITPFMLQPTHINYSTYRSAFWKDYTWDSVNSEWVPDGTVGAVAKTTHSAVESISVLDNIDISFVNGPAPIESSFVAGEFFSFVLGKGFMKDNGSTYSCDISFSLDTTKQVSINSAVPQAALGVLVDEPVTFQPLDPNYSGDYSNTSCIQNKGLLIAHPVNTTSNKYLISNQLIPNSTPFDFRFKWISFTGLDTTSLAYLPSIGLATGTTSYAHGLRFVYYSSNANLSLRIYNNTTLLATIANPSIDGQCRIVRDINNDIICEYDPMNGGAIVTTLPVNSTSTYVILAASNSGSKNSGWYDLKLDYTEGRRVLRVGDQTLSTGYYDPKFSALSYTGLANDTKIYVGTGSPLQMTLDYTPAGNISPLAASGTIKVAPGAGWLIFSDLEGANPVTGNTVAHFVI